MCVCVRIRADRGCFACTGGGLGGNSPPRCDRPSLCTEFLSLQFLPPNLCRFYVELMSFFGELLSKLCPRRFPGDFAGPKSPSHIVFYDVALIVPGDLARAKSPTTKIRH